MSYMCYGLDLRCSPKVSPHVFRAGVLEGDWITWVLYSLVDKSIDECTAGCVVRRWGLFRSGVTGVPPGKVYPCLGSSLLLASCLLWDKQFSTVLFHHGICAGEPADCDPNLLKP